MFTLASMVRDVFVVLLMFRSTNLGFTPPSKSLPFFGGCLGRSGGEGLGRDMAVPFLAYLLYISYMRRDAVINQVWCCNIRRRGVMTYA